MKHPPLTRRRLAAAVALALVADLLDLAVTGAEDFSLGLGLVPGEAISAGLDVVVMALMTRLLGFHWLFLPSFLLELVPEVEALPTWLGCVGLVAWQRRRAERPAVAAPRPVAPLEP
jgi:hypothetical protein